MHSLRGLPHVIDVRNYGLIGAVELEPRPGKPGARAFDVFLKCFERGVMVRVTGDTIALSPPLIIESEADRADRRDAGGGDSRDGLRRLPAERPSSALRRPRLAQSRSWPRRSRTILAGLGDFPDALEPAGTTKASPARNSCFSPVTDSMRTRPSISTQNSCSVYRTRHLPLVLVQKPQKNCWVGVGVLIRNPRPRNAGQNLLGRGIGGFAGLKAVQHHDLGMVGHALS